MGILDQQILGGGTPSATGINPFPDKLPEDVAKTGFGGYTYAPEDLAVVLSATETRTGPQEGGADLGTSTEYGPVGRRIGPTEATILGQMADMLSAHGAEADDANASSWNTVGGGKKMAYTFTNSTTLKSLRDKTVSGAVPNASGGATVGYDFNTKYGVSNWETIGTFETTQSWTDRELLDAAAAYGARYGKGDRNAFADFEDWKEKGLVTAEEQEIFNGTSDIKTGLRSALFDAPTS